ncbi:MAG TPA: ABC transporter permease [Ilumatobacter sp.]|nr:ABC transporter permease [Ilumatobacter sp.]
MSDVIEHTPDTAPKDARRWFEGRNLAVVMTVVGIVIISTVRLIADADRLTSSTTVGTGLRLAIPIALAGIGGLYAERSGTVNIGLDGMMTLGTVMAGWAGWNWGPWAALIAGILGGVAGAMLMSLATTNFGVNHVIAGFAINIIGPGVARFLANVWFTTPEASAAGGSITSSPRITGGLPRVSFPVLSDGPDLLGDLEGKGWFVLSDLAGILKGLTTDVRFDSMLAVALIVLTAYVIWRTPFGLRLRAAGEKPGAAESLGVSVNKMRHAGMAISGGFAGLGGAVLVFAGANQYQAGQVAGRGFLGLASLVFGNWMPAGVVAGAGVFGYAQSVAISLDSGVSVRALILAAAIALTLLAVQASAKRSHGAAAVELVFAALAFTAYSLVEEVNSQFVYMTPYVVTLIVITVFSKRQRPPSAAGIPYFKGQSL